MWQTRNHYAKSSQETLVPVKHKRNDVSIEDIVYYRQGAVWPPLEYVFPACHTRLTKEQTNQWKMFSAGSKSSSTTLPVKRPAARLTSHHSLRDGYSTEQKEFKLYCIWKTWMVKIEIFEKLKILKEWKHTYKLTVGQIMVALCA